MSLRNHPRLYSQGNFSLTPRVRALKLAIESLKDDVQRVAFDANLHERLGSDCPVAVKASKHRRKLQEAIGELEKMMKETK